MPLALDQAIWRSFLYLEALDRRTLGRLIPALTPPQYHALAALTAQPAQGLGDLAARLLCAKATASDLVSRLVTLGLVESRRDPADARRLLLTLTPAGTSALDAAVAARAAALDVALAPASGPRMEVMADFLAELTTLLERAVLGTPGEPTP